MAKAAAATKKKPSASAAAAAGAAPRKKPTPNSRKDEYLSYYREMLLIRRFEERAAQLYGMGLIGGFCHLYIGQEAVVTGMQACVTNDDAVITTYRDHGHMLSRGMEARGVMAELTGREGGYSRGKGGSMHMFSTEKNFYGGHGIVGASVPIGTGIGFAFKYRKQNNLCLTYFGDGAVNQGQVYEAFNMAALWKLPVIYIVENNEYAMGTSVKRSSSVTELYRRGESFGIPGMQVDGMDVLKVREAGEKAVAHVRAGKGPILLEMKTYRYRGHSMSDPAKYRSKDEVESYREQQDPIARLSRTIQEETIASQKELDAIEAEVKEIVLDAVEFAKTSPEPDVAELWTDITQ